MLKCPFCGFENEDGALFCEQCKSDLSSVAPVAAVPPVEAVPMAAVIEEETVPMAAVVAEETPAAEVVEAPVAAAASLGMPAPPPPLPVEPVPAEVAAPAAAAAAAGKTSVPPGASPKLVVIRGQKINMEFPIYPDNNFIGRADEKPVDIDLEDQEPPDRVWCSRQHAVIEYNPDQGLVTIEDLNSANGTFVNRNRVHPGQKHQLYLNDTVQIGTVHLKLKA
jgi:hypothetical protein